MRAKIDTVVPMATAIVRGYCAAGFVIAADGRMTESGPGGNILISDTLQKIFPIGESLAYGCKGTTHLGDRREQRLETVYFDFTHHFSKHLSAAGNKYSSLVELATTAAHAINEDFAVACQNPNIDLTPVYARAGGGFEVANLFIDGYFRGCPERVWVRFWQEAGRPGPPDIIPEQLEVACWRYGSEAVVRKLTTDLLFAAKYSLENYGIGDKYGADLSSLIHQAAVFIEASKSDEALHIDRETSSGIGGHTHIAVLPRGGRFEWVKPPASSPSAP